MKAKLNPAVFERAAEALFLYPSIEYACVALRYTRPCEPLKQSELYDVTPYQDYFYDLFCPYPRTAGQIRYSAWLGSNRGYGDYAAWERRIFALLLAAEVLRSEQAEKRQRKRKR